MLTNPVLGLMPQKFWDPAMYAIASDLPYSKQVLQPTIMKRGKFTSVRCPVPTRGSGVIAWGFSTNHHRGIISLE